MYIKISVGLADSRSDNRKSKIEKRPRRLKWVGLSIIAFVLVVGGVAVEAQQPTKIPRTAYLSASSSSTNPERIEAFRQGVRELGYVEGKNIVIEWRHAEEKLDRLPALAAELVYRFIEPYLLAMPCVMLTAWLENRLVPNWC